MGKKLKVISLAVIIFMLLGFMSAFAAAGDGTIASNVYINNIDVSGMARDEAMNVLKQSTEPTINISCVFLKYGSSSWKINFTDIGAVYEYDKALDAAFQIQNDVPQANTTTTGEINLNPVRHDITMGITCDKGLIQNQLDLIAQKVYAAPINPTYKVQNNKSIIVPGKEGTQLNKEKAVELIVSSLVPGEVTELELPVDKIKPAALPKQPTAPAKKPAEEEKAPTGIAAGKDKLGEFTTYFNAGDKNRVTNISIAERSVTNSVVMPGEIFSINKTVGPRIEKYGFKLAHVIVNNELVDGIGGGICQVSSTLYNAALFANLKIIERNNHSLRSSYVPMGRDATISGDSKDFKFQNNTKYPIYIVGELKDNFLKFTIYGKQQYPTRTVKIKTNILSKTKPVIRYINDPSLPKGKVVTDRKASTGYTVESIREVYDKGKLLYSEKLFTDKYPMVSGIKRRGTKN